jgi:hypothetical protein
MLNDFSLYFSIHPSAQLGVTLSYVEGSALDIQHC